MTCVGCTHDTIEHYESNVSGTKGLIMCRNKQCEGKILCDQALEFPT